MRRWYVTGQGQTMVIVPAPGVFWMGSGLSEHEPRHRRRIGRSYAIGAAEVTVRQFQAFRKQHRSNKVYSPTPDSPVTMVAWHEAAAYCNWLSRLEGIPGHEWCYEAEQGGPEMKPAPGYLQRVGYRLPTEAEWEYACRAGAGTAFSFGRPRELLGKYGWHGHNSSGRSHPRGELKPNDLGLFDMHGNAWEYCQNRYDRPFSESKSESITDDVEDYGSTSGHVLRGGAFGLDASFAQCACRSRYVTGPLLNNTGFRLARTHR
jgi:formylglycine-generating enzyme required for sulfatase activity